MPPDSENILLNLYLRMINLQKQLNEIENCFKRDFIDVQRDFKKICDDLAYQSSNASYVRKNALIVRFVNKLLSNGLTFDESIIICSAKLNESFTRCQQVYNFHKNRDIICNRIAKQIIVKRLIELNYPKKEIARITGYSEKYIYDFFKKINQKSRF